MTNNINLEKLLNEFGAQGNIIGFANKFYTLWSYAIIENIDTHKLSFDAYFIKNIGATNTYEGVFPFEPSLKGAEIHFISTGEFGGELTKQEIKALKFSKGRYRGHYINECADADFLCWAYNVKFVSNSSSSDYELTNIYNRAVELGCVLIEKTLYTPDAAAGKTFSCNPSRGAMIDECNDDGLLCWKYNKNAVDADMCKQIQEAELENIKHRALELGAVEYNNRMYSVKNQGEEWFAKIISVNDLISKNAPIKLTPEHNLNDMGELIMNGVIFRFESRYYPSTYYGPSYCLPVDEKGKSKRIKNKTIEITEYEKLFIPAHEDVDYYGDSIHYNDRTVYVVKSWKIVK